MILEMRGLSQQNRSAHEYLNVLQAFTLTKEIMRVCEGSVQLFFTMFKREQDWRCRKFPNFVGMPRYFAAQKLQSIAARDRVIGFSNTGIR